MEDREFGTDLNWDTGVLGLWYPCRMCVFDVNIVNIDAEYYDVRYPLKILSHN